MPATSDWKVPRAVQPKASDYPYDLDRALTSIVGVHATIPADAFTAEVLGVERAGNGVLIEPKGLVLTVGYLIVEADTIWLSLGDGGGVQGHVLGYDHETGFGLIQALGSVNLPTLPLGSSAAVSVGERVVIGGAGGTKHSVAARIVAKQEFSGYWEYALDEAIFTAPAHPNWGGTALIGPSGDLLGIGSLQLQREVKENQHENLNMVVPIDLLKPILEDLKTIGRPNRPPRPWLGVYVTEVEGKIAVAGLASGAPAQKADLRSGDILLAVGGVEVNSLAEFYNRLWSLGPAGVEVPLTVHRSGESSEMRIVSGDRNRYLKGPSVH
ncbi:MAG: S1C family serine protease [Alphaproteobacteria bacterium]